ncbi:MAG: bifunctional [Acetobacter sp.]|nr:bifunctional [glutamine synthetase] adenylyltransferase/[glutamine synthetase]-adenylyl-L-tyrosine phosphorylase [Acetobacter sp.]
MTIQTKHFFSRNIRSSCQHNTQVWPCTRWPKPADRVMAADFVEEIHKLSEKIESKSDILQNASVRTLIACLGGNSPYLSDLVRGDIAGFITLLENGPKYYTQVALTECAKFNPNTKREEVVFFLRTLKKKIALACAVADLGGFWTLEEITMTLSSFAEAALELAIRHLLLRAFHTGQLELPNPEDPTRGCGFTVLAMGKLGSRELNFSSDIDIMVLYDPSFYTRSDDVRRVFIRLTNDLVNILEAHDEYGYVFRTDLRLRPDPSSTPPAVTVQAALVYYESLGQTWERAAMIRARTVAGDITLGKQFLADIRPFIWRRNLDFTLIDDLHDMKDRIDSYRHTGRRNLSELSDTMLMDATMSYTWLLGHNVKLGQGGIREIEFIAQAKQLIWGGREHVLREKTTCGALKKLAAAGYLTYEEANVLIEAYYLLRETEHRLQMQNDYQTHSLPEDEVQFNSFAVFMNYPDGCAFAQHILPYMREVRRIFERNFITDHESVKADQNILISDLEEGKIEEVLLKYGFQEQQIAKSKQVLARWQGCSVRALRSARAQALLRSLFPLLLKSFSQSHDPFACLLNFDAFLTCQHAGVQVLTLFKHHPELIDKVTHIFNASPFLSDYLANHPSALEGLLEMAYDTTRVAVTRLYKSVKEVKSVEEKIKALCPLLRGEEFRLSVALLEGYMSEEMAERERTSLADVIIKILWEAVIEEHTAKYGHVHGGGMAVIALGRLGSREMMPASDLDLMIVCDYPETVQESFVKKGESGRSLEVNAYYTRLARALFAALTAPGTEGPLYTVDMRLRPSGRSGPIVVSRKAFLHYYANSAWTWERMALTRARIIVAPYFLRSVLTQDLAQILDGTILTVPPTCRSLREDARNMRLRLARDLPSTSMWDIKRRDGGLMEIEFIAQIFQLCAADARVRSPITRYALRRLAREGVLTKEQVATLCQAGSFWRRLQAQLRLLYGPKPPVDLEKELGHVACQVLLRNMKMRDIPALIERTEQLAKNVRGCFESLIGCL